MRAIGVAVIVMACTALPSASPPPSASDVTASPATPGPASPAITPATSPTPVPTADLGGWRKVATTDVMGNGPTDVAWFKDRWVAIGVDRSTKRWRPLAWSSTDGVAWTASRLGAIPGRAVSSDLVSLAVRGDLLVAVGWSSSELSQSASVDLARSAGGSGPGHVTTALAREGPHPIPAAACFPTLRSADALVMTSTDGVVWTTVPERPSLKGQPMLGVAVRDGGFIAVGGADGTRRSATWTSPDGVAWTRGPDSPALQAGVMQGVLPIGDALVAWGFFIDPDVCPAPMLWRSVDGSEWSLVSDPVGTQSLWRSISTAATATMGLTVVGTTAGGPLDLTTADGTTWSQHVLPDDLTYGPIIASGGGFLAGGAQSLWRSPDGDKWAVVSTPQVQFQLLATGPGGTIAIGDATDPGSGPFVSGNDVWLGPAGGP
ncbi:MAG: hypothetical protein HYX55_07600 [Chloroflexi bacterium]|nr:hypothetical protein [Chloroflexota bacterium]